MTLLQVVSAANGGESIGENAVCPAMRERIEQRWMVAAGVIGLAFALAAAGCAGVERTPPREEPSMASTVPTEPAAPGAPRTGGRKKAAPATQPDTRQAPPPAVEPPTSVAAGPSQVPTPAQAAGNKEMAAAPVEKPAPPAVKPTPPVTAKPAPPPAAKPAAPPAPNPAPLDLTALEKRLKETNAIGVFTKLTLKNQVDELLDRFRAHYEGRVKITLSQLRQPYDMLILKVLTLLQDGDPSLARAVAESREAIWGILSDPNKFKNL